MCGAVFVSAKLYAGLLVLISAAATPCGKLYIEVVGNVDNVSTHDLAKLRRNSPESKDCGKGCHKQFVVFRGGVTSVEQWERWAFEGWRHCL